MPQAEEVSQGVRHLHLYGLCIAFVVCAIVLVWLKSGAIVDMLESGLLTLAPSAERAYVFGSKHLDAREHPSNYDINRAEYFLNRALALDPALPQLHHQLARVAFLRGNLFTALGLIDEEIALGKNISPSSYYVRGLILGYMGRYVESAESYERYLAFDPHNWAAINDYAWVLLKDGRAREAVVATAGGLKYFPNNAWLLNTNAIALYEIEEVRAARDQARAALKAAEGLSVHDWLLAYPGNDPRVAQEGVNALQSSIAENMHTILIASATSTVE